MMFYTVVLHVIKTMYKRKIGNDTYLSKKREEKDNSATIMMSVDGEGTVFSVRFKLEEESFE